MVKGKHPMIGASKILTVSYGTFSCTLEGFDDPFNTMRAIAEYFRELAAEDRYFGAEPPTPDAAMLHRIAEREIQRRVETKIQSNGVILRAGDIDGTDRLRPQADPGATALAAPTLAPEDAARDDSAQDESIVARLSRLRDAQTDAQLDAQLDARTDAAAPPFAPVPLHAQDEAGAAATPTEPDADSDAAPAEDAPDAAGPPDHIEPVADAGADPAGGPVVDRGETDGIAAQADADPQPFRAAEKSDDEILFATLGAMIDPLDDDEVQVGGIVAAASRPVDTPQGQALGTTPDDPGTRAFAPADPAPPLAAPPARIEPDQAGPAPAAPGPQGSDRLQRARARVIKIRRVDPASDGPDAAPPGPRNSADRAPVVAASPTGAGSVLSPEAEAELQRELAALEADEGPFRPQAPKAPTARPQQAVVEPPRLPDPSPAEDAVNRLISQTNSAMEGPENKRRLAAIAHLKAAVAATFADRKANIGTLLPGPAERMDPYRDDLDRVVRPRRPALVAPGEPEAATPTARPQADTRPAPLVLVSEQRIDRPKPDAAVPGRGPVTPVRPRRVTAALGPAATQTNDRAADEDDEDEDGYLSRAEVGNIFADPTQPFAEFAERLGATSMTDLIEAAAAYCALMLGRDQFSRPLLLQQIADLPDGDAINREDCLRGFGVLLRDGRIEKIKRGQFKLSDQSRYLAEGKRLAG